MFLKIAMTGVLFAYSALSLAQQTPITCISNGEAGEANFVLDETHRSVTMYGSPAKNVMFTSQQVVFSIDTAGGTYSHVLSRSTGTMSVIGPNGKMLSPFGCQRSQANKF